MKKLFLLGALALILGGCTTHLFQPVSSLIEAQWIQSPQEPGCDSSALWTFKNDGTCDILLETGGCQFDSLPALKYTIESSWGHYYLHVDGLASHQGYDPARFKWIIVTCNSTTLYLESDDLQANLIGQVQYGFVKK